MHRWRRISCTLLSILLIVVLLTSCWSSKEIEERSLYVGMGIDVGERTKVEVGLESQGKGELPDPIITATIQIVPLKSKSNESVSVDGNSKKYLNVSETGDSIFEIMRNYILRRDRAIIGQHLKMLVMSNEVVEKIPIDKLLDFMLRDNDIRPSCLVFFSLTKASEVLKTTRPDEVPTFHIVDMVKNQFRSNKIMSGINLTDFDYYIQTKQSFILQNIADYDGEVQFYGAGIIKGSTGKWIGNLTQDDVASISWIQGKQQGGLIKSMYEDELITYEIKSVSSKIIPSVKDGKISFHVEARSEGRLIENWESIGASSKRSYLEELEQAFMKQIDQQLQTTIDRIQKEYKVDVAGFGKALSLHYPKVWKRVKENWDEVFSETNITTDIKLIITDYGASTD